MTNEVRQPRGQTNGGEFAASANPEASVDLDSAPENLNEDHDMSQRLMAGQDDKEFEGRMTDAELIAEVREEHYTSPSQVFGDGVYCHAGCGYDCTPGLLADRLESLLLENERLRGVVQSVAQYDPRWEGQHVNDAPSRSQLVERSFDALIRGENS